MPPVAKDATVAKEAKDNPELSRRGASSYRLPNGADGAGETLQINNLDVIEVG